VAEPFLSEIRIVSFNFAPKGWVLCAGQLLPINQNQALFALIGTTYGGDGRVNFALPDLRSRVPLHMGQGHILGERGGEENHTLSQSEMPAHIHPATADVKLGDANAFNPNNSYIANTAPIQMYSSGSNNMVAMFPAMVSTVGGSQAHTNQQPYLTLNFVIALQGIFPTQN
jgi:microcystin-dependent protein